MARGHSRSARPTFLIVTNGEVTERQYFEYFRRFVPSLRIKTIKGASPKQVVEKANKFSREAKREGAQYTKVWAVFDQDNYGKEIKNLRQSRQSCVLITSIPCFEVWLIWHFEDMGGVPETKQVQDRWEKVIGKYLAENSKREQTAKARKQLPGDLPYDKWPEAHQRHNRLNGEGISAPIGDILMELRSVITDTDDFG